MRVQLRFEIGLHIREKELIKGLASFFKLGNSIPKDDCAPVQGVLSIKPEVDAKYVYITDDSVHLQIINIKDIQDIIIPFFEKHPIQGKKSLDFLDFKKVAELIKNKEHLTREGFDKILEIKAKMNKTKT